MSSTDSGERAAKKDGEKAKLIHAPMSDVGGIMYDKDAVYVNVPAASAAEATVSFSSCDGTNKAEPKGEGEQMVMGPARRSQTFADRIGESQIKLFGHSAAPLEVQQDRVRRLAEPRSGGPMLGSADDEDEDEEEDGSDFGRR